MTSQLLNLPINIPWNLIAASPDMMDTKFCDKLFPYAWRTSLALSVYEPRPEDLPEELCEQRITYLKLTCSITGYQPSKDETDKIVDVVSYPSGQTTEDILGKYFACYGVLVNIAVFPRKIIKTYRDVPLPESFQQLPPDPPNPFELGPLQFVAEGASHNHGVDIFPQGGDNQTELDLQKKLIVTLPSSHQIEKVRARIAHFGTKVSMEAFKGNNSVGSSIAEQDENTVHDHELVIESEEGIDRVVFTTPEGSASLVEFIYTVVIEESTIPQDLEDYPHIIDFEPKMRDLYQASTESGEVLSDSKSGIKTDKSFTHTDSTQASLDLGVKFPIPNVPGATGDVSTKLTNTDTDQSQWSVETDASRERRETQGTTTQISQLYNLLTGYHVGTNRAVFLMLARPHVLQPTDFRTFVQGLRAIEGVQEFFLIVIRPKDIDGLCVEAFLETGNFPEDTQINEPPTEYYESEIDFPVTKHSDNGPLRDCTKIDTDYTIPLDWVIDQRPQRDHDPGHPGIKMWEERSNTQAQDSLTGYNYFASSDTTVRVEGEICGSRWTWPIGDPADFDRTYRVFLRSPLPKPTHQQPSADAGYLIITNRGLCVCFNSGDCPEVVSQPEPTPRDVSHLNNVIVDEPMIKINPALLTRAATSNSRSPAMKDFLRQVERSMSNSWRMPSRYPIGEVGFLESEYFKDQIKEILPPDYLRTPLSEIAGIPDTIIQALGERVTVSEVLDINLSELARRTSISIAEAARVRRLLLRLESGEIPNPR